MASSPARIAANQLNAQKSTGPKSPEGKAASRLNAFKHGLAGGGDLVAPTENLDGKLIADRTSAFHRELGAVGDVGGLLAHRAALLSVRMERAAEHEVAFVADRVAAAQVQFDRDRLAALDGWLEAFDDHDPALRSAVVDLAKSPEGVAHLEVAYAEVRDAIRLGDRESFYVVKRVVTMLGLSEDEADAIEHDDMPARIDLEIKRLRASVGSMTEQIKAISHAREQAGIIARFDPGPEATLARRYEAAAERGMYRAIRAIAEIRRTHERTVTAPEALAEAVQLPPVARTLGSFRAELPAAPIPPAKPLLGPVEPPMIPVGHPKKRPDLRKLALSRR